MINITASDSTLTGTKIVEKVEDIMTPESSKMKVKMTILTTSGEKRDFIYWIYSKNHGEKTLIRYQSPSQVKNQSTLMLNNADDIWAYFPRTGRVRKLATHAKKRKMQGSDFSYEDIGGGKTFKTDYNAKRLTDCRIRERECFKVLLTTLEDKSTNYSKLVTYVDKGTFHPLLIEYYHSEDSSLLQKKLIASEIKEVDGIPTAHKMKMANLLDDGETVIKALEVKYNIELPDMMFTVRGLKK